MNDHEWNPTYERLWNAFLWVVTLAMLVLTLFAISGDDFTRLLPWHNVAAATKPTNLLIGATDTDREFLARMEGRAQLAEDLLAGRLTLLEAAARCRDLDRNSPSFNLQRFRRLAPGGSDEERYCRLLIRGAEGILANRPNADPDAIHLLTEELARRQREGTLTLPSNP